MNTPTNNSNQTQSLPTQFGNLNLEVRQARMYTIMREEAINFICNIFINLPPQELNNHDFVAKSIKMHMDKAYGPPWHCVVGKGFGSAVTYLNKNFLYLYISNKAIMIFRH